MWEKLRAIIESSICPDACTPLLFQNREGMKQWLCPECELEEIRIWLRCDWVMWNSYDGRLLDEDFLALPVMKTIQ